MKTISTLTVAMVLLLLTPGLRAQKVEVGFDKQADFSMFHTYQWIVPPEGSSARPLLAASIMGAIDEELKKKGLQQMQSGADLKVSVSGGVETGSVSGGYDPAYTSAGGAPTLDATMWAGALPTGGPQYVQKGTLVVDLIKAYDNKLVWRGEAKAKLDYQDKDKLVSQVNKSVEEMFSHYPPSPEDEKNKHK